MPAVEAAGMWEGWKAGFLAFHAFQTLSFSLPAFGNACRKSQSLRRAVLGTGTTYPSCRLFVQVESFPPGISQQPPGQSHERIVPVQLLPKDSHKAHSSGQL